jgi:hypothetical protein
LPLLIHCAIVPGVRGMPGGSGVPAAPRVPGVPGAGSEIAAVARDRA